MNRRVVLVPFPEVAAFDVEFRELRRLAKTEAVYLVPEPAEQVESDHWEPRATFPFEAP